MEIIFTQLNPHACRTYLIENPRTKEAVLIDPVLDHVPDYLKLLQTKKLILSTTIDTHTHADHLSGSSALLDHLSIEYLMHEKSEAACPTSRIHDGDKRNLAGVSVTFIETPGHTKDSISILLPGKILTGDALFLDEA